MRHEEWTYDPKAQHVKCTCGWIGTRKGFAIHRGMKNK